DLAAGDVAQLQLDTVNLLQGLQAAGEIAAPLGQVSILGKGGVGELVVGDEADAVGHEYDTHVVIHEFVVVVGHHVVDAGEHAAEAAGVGEVRVVDDLRLRQGLEGEKE